MINSLLGFNKWRGNEVENVKNIMCKFDTWFENVCSLAMKTEWCLDYEPDYWLPKYRKGLSPDVALNEYWKENFN